MNIESLRLILIEELDKLEERETIRLSELGYSERLLDKLLFDYIEINNETYKELAILIEEILSRINFTGISFDSFKCSGFNFSRLKGISINPQKIYHKSLVDCIFTGVTFNSIFDDCCISGSDFTGVNGVEINPSTLFDCCLNHTKLNGVAILGNFDGADIQGTNFTGLRGAEINPQTIFEKDLSDTICTDVEFIGIFDGVKMQHTILEGSNYCEMDIMDDDFRARLKSRVKQINYYYED